MEPRDIRHEFAEVNGIRLHYAAAGAGRLMLFLHGFPEFWYAWRKQLLEFGRDHLAVAPDQRGYNLSSKPREVSSYAIPHLIADIRAFAEKFTQAPFVLVAHDWGGMAAWAFAIRYPERLRKLIILNTPHPATFARELRHNPAQQRASAYFKRFRRPWTPWLLSLFRCAALDHNILKPLIRAGHFTEADRAEYLNAWQQPGALRGGLCWYRAAPLGSGEEMENYWKREFGPAVVRVPTLVLYGERDPFLLPGGLDGIEQFVPDVRIHRYPDATHWIAHEMPEEVNRRIREFIA